MTATHARAAVAEKITEMADEIFELRKRITPAIRYLTADLWHENIDFIDWDKGLWDLHDFLLRRRGALQDPERSPDAILEEVRLATARLPEVLERIDEFSSRPWWRKVDFNSAEN